MTRPMLCKALTSRACSSVATVMLTATTALAAAAASAVVVASAGCGGKRQPSTRVEDAAVAPAAAAAAAAPSAGAKARPLDDAALAALAAVAITGMRIDIARRGPGDFGAVITADDGTSATVTVSRCAICAPLDVATWERDRAAWTTLLAPAPDDTLMIDRVDLGAPFIRLRAARTIEAIAESLVSLHWNDGSAQLWLTCARPDSDEPCATLVTAAAPRYLTALAR